jgi:long-chain acyl-CoA synthetase
VRDRSPGHAPGTAPEAHPEAAPGRPEPGSEPGSEPGPESAADPPGGLAALLTRSAAAHPQRRAVRLDEDVLTFAELDELSARAAALLRARGLAPGDRVALVLPNVPEFVVLYYGVLRAGAIVVPMNPGLKTDEVAYCLTDSEASFLFAWEEAEEGHAAGAAAAAAAADRCGIPCLTVREESFRSKLRRHPPHGSPEPRLPSDTAVILYTSGTTGRPKGAELTHANIARNTEIAATRVLHLVPQDVVFGGLPLFHSFGQVFGLNCAVRSGACLTLLRRFEAAKAAAVLARDRVTVLAAVPSMYTLLLGLDEGGRGGTGALRVAVSGGAPLPGEVLHGFERAFACPVLEGYGLSETSPLACINRLDRPRRAGTIGYPVEGVRVCVADGDGREVPDGTVGEICVSGHNVMKGYWRRPRDTAAAMRSGWLRTGDLGVRDEDGCFRVVGRSKEVIIRGGMNVYPREVEEVLYRHPAVAEAAVIGVPHAVYGEEIGAAVVLRPGHALSPARLREFVRERVASYKYPRVVWFPEALPKGATGKILKREVTPPAGGPPE